MALDRSKPKPTVFLSFAGEDVEWKRTFMEPNWWAALTKVAEIRDYDNDPARYGDLYTSMAELVRQSAAFIVILSKFYLRKDGIIEHEFKTAADRFSASGRHYDATSTGS
jgi:ketosteroid isomerase-like protein